MAQRRKSRKRDQLVVGGLAVHELIPQNKLAGDLGLSTRQLRNLEDKGLPTYSEGGRKSYPVPHVYVWWGEYTIEVQRTGSCARLSWAEALQRDRASEAAGA